MSKERELLQKIDGDALRVLCELYDAVMGEYPKHASEGAAVHRFFKKLAADETSKASFADHIKESTTLKPLRELFYNYFIAHYERLPQDNRACKEEIIHGIYTFFEMKEKRDVEEDE